MYYLVGQALNILGLPNVHPTLSTVCLDMSYVHPLLTMQLEIQKTLLIMT